MSEDQDADALIHLNELGQMSAGVGHHVINAFSAIVSNAEMLRLLSDESTRVVDPVVIAETIIHQAMEASGVARRLIDYSRRATTPGGTPLPLNDVVRAVVERERPRQESITWNLDLGPIPPIRGQEWQIIAMLGHLLDNAREAMSATGGSITISTSCDDRGWVVIEVADTGLGMTPTEQERAVEPFFTTKAGHTGVGLSIANGIWRRHRGTLAVRSRAGEGARVRLCIDPNPPS